MKKIGANSVLKLIELKILTLKAKWPHGTKCFQTSWTTSSSASKERIPFTFGIWFFQTKKPAVGVPTKSPAGLLHSASSTARVIGRPKVISTGMKNGLMLNIRLLQQVYAKCQSQLTTMEQYIIPKWPLVTLLLPKRMGLMLFLRSIGLLILSTIKSDSIHETKKT